MKTRPSAKTRKIATRLFFALLLTAAGCEADGGGAGATVDSGPADTGTIGDAGADPDTGTSSGGGTTDASQTDTAAGADATTAKPKSCNPKSMAPAALCPKGEFCDSPAGKCGEIGECKATPDACDTVYDPVCGCDNKTYSNSCTAAGAGVSVASKGECGGSGLKHYATCGDPVCQGEWKPTDGVPLCTNEKVGEECGTEGQKCDAKAGCGVFVMCAKSDPTASGCPKSRRSLKSDIRYLDGSDRRLLAHQLLTTRLATYRYTAAGPNARRHLGFIIDDRPDSPAVDARRDMVDLYGYLSMSVAALQEQQRQIQELRDELTMLKQQRGAAEQRVCQ